MMFKHVKTQHVYEFIALTILEDTFEPGVVYAIPNTDTTFVRPAAEFFDGRFVPFIPDWMTSTPADINQVDDEPTDDDDEPDQTIGQALEIKHRKEH